MNLAAKKAIVILDKFKNLLPSIPEYIVMKSLCKKKCNAPFLFCVVLDIFTLCIFGNPDNIINNLRDIADRSKVRLLPI